MSPCHYSNMVVYVASKTRHAERWKSLRDSGLRINSSWIDEAKAGQTECVASLAASCIVEAASADAVLLYLENDEVSCGALLEAGAALANGAVVISVSCRSVSRVFAHHPNWREASDLDSAIRLLGLLAQEQSVI